MQNNTKKILEGLQVLNKYPGRIPIIVEVRTKKIHLENSKYIVPSDLTLGQFQHYLKKKCKSENEAFFCYVKNTLPSPSSILKSLYANYKSEDNMLHLTIDTEECFG
jgi:hypothetical protein